ncbi:MAG: helix-hairpin-helix domain-containing protein [Myxococcota bacterium]
MESLPVLPRSIENPVGLNDAKLEDFMTIQRLPVRVARAILERRERIGRFKRWEEVAEIRGVGPKTLDKLKTAMKIF